MNWLEEQEFYELMQSYRHAPIHDHGSVVAAFEAVKRIIRDKCEERERCDSLRARLLEMEAVHEDLSGQILEAVDAERERLRVLVEAVRDANAAEANGDYQFRVLTERQERAWLALMAGLEAPNVLVTWPQRPAQKYE